MRIQNNITYTHTHTHIKDPAVNVRVLCIGKSKIAQYAPKASVLKVLKLDNIWRKKEVKKKSENIYQTSRHKHTCNIYIYD